MSHTLEPWSVDVEPRSEDAEAGWTVVLDDDDGFGASVRASLLALCNGEVGVRGDQEERPDVDHYLLVAGAYGTGADGLVRPLPGPAWTVLANPDELADDRDGQTCRWVLDLRAGTVERTSGDGGLRTLRFASVARPGVLTLSAEDEHVDRPWPDALSPPNVATGHGAAHEWTSGVDDGYTWARTTGDRTQVTVVAAQRSWRLPDRRRLERIAVLGRGAGAGRYEAADLLHVARRLGHRRLLEEHREAMAERWQHADIEIDGDPPSQRAIRFALFHLLTCAPTTGTAGVGARGLTGLAYAGHVFWDTDVYVLPALAATLPGAARAMIAYRTERLATARRNAAERGLPGARYPWESADSGRDVTPRRALDLDGRVVPIRTGGHAEHINADIAWAVDHYSQWTGDENPLDGAARRMVLDTARYWRARIRTDAAGTGHLYGVTGPDEYHEVVDDNAYTNGMARWHLRWAATLARESGSDREAAEFEAAADALADNHDAATDRHEQFAGYWQLEPLLIRDLVEPPIAADVLLGRDRVRQTQVIKQPDVMMLHHLLPETCPPGSRRADLDFYLPRTAHGSSLSPAICAALLARDGRPDDAMDLFDLAAGVDLDDLTGTTSGGLHLATMGGLWQAVVNGFMGIRPAAGRLCIDPCLPARWSRCSVRLRFQGVPVRVTATHETVAVECDARVSVVIGGTPMHAPVCVSAPTRSEGNS